MSMGSLTLFANAQFIAYLLVLYFTKWVICNTKKNCAFVNKVSDPMFLEYCHNSISTYLLSIFLGIANYPFGKMQYQQVCHELSICE